MKRMITAKIANQLKDEYLQRKEVLRVSAIEKIEGAARTGNNCVYLLSKDIHRELRSEIVAAGFSLEYEDDEDCDSKFTVVRW